MSMSSSDWTRIQRLKQARTYATTIAANKDVINKVTPGNPFNPETKISRVVGSSKTRRDASRWIDFVASQDQTYELKSSNYTYTTPGAFKGTQNTLTKLCNCTTAIVNSKRTGCKCNMAQHLRM
jgi:hypothetical protein